MQTDTHANPQRLWLALTGAGLFLLLLRPQPVWLPLVENYHALRDVADIESAAPLLIADYERQPWSATRAQNAGQGALAAADFSAAQQYFAEAARLGGWTPALYRHMGDAYQGQGDREQALAHWEAAFAAGLNDADMLARLATIYEQTGSYSEAEAVLVALTAAQPDNAPAHYRLGVVRLALAPAQAVAPLLTAREQAPALAPAADALLAVIDTVEQARGEGADEADILTTLSYGLVRVQEYGLATKLLNDALAADPTLAVAHTYLGLVQEQQGLDGLVEYQQALALNPDSPLTHLLLGRYWRQRGNVAQALAAFDTAYELDPLNPDLSVEIGNTYLAEGDLNNAETWYSNATRLLPESPTLWAQLAAFYFDNDFKAESAGIAAAERAAQLGPNHAAAQDALGVALWLQGRLEEAEAALTEALALSPDSARTAYHLGLVYSDMGRNADAIAALQTAVALDPEGVFGNRALNALARLGAGE